MGKSHDKMPVSNAVIREKGIISHVWHRFLYKLFKNFEDRLQALETTTADHETRITALEP